MAKIETILYIQSNKKMKIYDCPYFCRFLTGCDRIGLSCVESTWLGHILSENLDG